MDASDFCTACTSYPIKVKCVSLTCNNNYCDDCYEKCGVFINGPYYCNDCNGAGLSELHSCYYCKSNSFSLRYCDNTKCARAMCTRCLPVYGHYTENLVWCNSCYFDSTLTKPKNVSSLFSRKCSLCTSIIKQYEILYSSEDGFICSDCAKLTEGKLCGISEETTEEAERRAKLERKSEIPLETPKLYRNWCKDCGKQFDSKIRETIYCDHCRGRTRRYSTQDYYQNSIVNEANNAYVCSLKELEQNKEVDRGDLSREIARAKRLATPISEDEQIAMLTMLLTKEKLPTMEPEAKPIKCYNCSSLISQSEFHEEDTYCDGTLCVRRLCRFCKRHNKFCPECKSTVRMEEPAPRCYNCGVKRRDVIPCASPSCFNFLCKQCEVFNSKCENCINSNDEEENQMEKRFEEIHKEIKQLKEDKKAMENILTKILRELQDVKTLLGDTQ